MASATRSGPGRHVRSIPPARAMCSPPPSSSGTTWTAIPGSPRPLPQGRVSRQLDAPRSDDYAGPQMTPGAGPRTIRITAGAVSATAQLNASRSALSLWDALPIEAKAQTWGDEIYFGIGIAIAAESPRATVDMGD